MNRCFSCFCEYEDEFDICPHCGTVKIKEPKEAIHLMPGTILYGRYLIGIAIGSGGFGTIYNAWDLKLDTVIAIKEFFVPRLMTRAGGTTEVIVNKKSEQEYLYRKERFLEEARNMAKFGAHRSIPNVFEFFEENGTAYIVMELLNGVALNDYLKSNDNKIDKEFALLITNEVGNALISLHEKGIIHRDVAPDNIFVCSDKELKIKLLDLGAAKLSDVEEDIIDIILKPGYSPAEQYENTSKVGPWTDVYALGATLYVMLTGIKPDESTNRKIKDELIPPHELDPSIPENTSNCIMKAMAVEKHLRYKNVSEFLKALNGNKKVISIVKEKKRRRNRRLFGILAACLFALLMAGGVYLFYGQKEAAQQLPEATISVWYSADVGSNEVAAMESLKSDFESKFHDVTLELRRIDEEFYAVELETAAINDQMPTIFESTDISGSLLESAEDVSEILQTQQALDCSFLSDYRNGKKVPLAMKVPVAIVITKGPSQIDYEDVYFEDLAVFLEQTDVAVDSNEKEFLEACFGEEIASFTKTEAELAGEDTNCAVMLTSSMQINYLQKEVLSGYTWHCAFYKGNNAKGQFAYEWSIGKGSEEEELAARKLLSWMLGNVYQNMLMVSRAQEGQIPLNKECFRELCKTDTKLTPLLSIYDDLELTEMGENNE